MDHGADINAVYNKMAQVPNGLANTQTQRTAFTDLCEQVSVNAHVDFKTQAAKAMYIVNNSQFNVKYVDDQKFTTLHWAISLKDARVIHDICKKDSSFVNATDVYNKTALKWTAEYYNAANGADKELWKNVATELVEHGANSSDLMGTDLFGADFHAGHAVLEQGYLAQDAFVLVTLMAAMQQHDH